MRQTGNTPKKKLPKSLMKKETRRMKKRSPSQRRRKGGKQLEVGRGKVRKDGFGEARKVKTTRKNGGRIWCQEQSLDLNFFSSRPKML